MTTKPPVDRILIMTPKERANSSILIIESDTLERNNLKTALRSLGFGMVSDSPNHAAALEKLDERKFTHIIFDAKKTNMPANEFLQKVFEGYPNIVGIPSSYQPSVDDVFDLLIMGAKGYLVKPFTVESVDQAILMATKGDPISDKVLQAKDRNEALVAIIMGSLDKVATLIRQSYQFDTAKREVPRSMMTFYRSADLAKTFAKGGDDGLLEAMEKFCIERGKGPATKLGRLRKRIHKDSPEAIKDDESENTEDS